ncbi:hypothetical protein BO71DRAFT_426045 [Aspergillus ellipticus CBS 707.79]|uniref:Uncharacterized protein n=1 Tax=Aspergillus ellipticus CBS 707.79 TaxID=1448320 RepID=A0A319DM46_9EURO|nr:hypothetical protein BO71DRAFT_426045 [Aspergillus ellipticus CBS 707.79]
MKVNLDQIEFYHGPSLQQTSTSAKKVSANTATAHDPRNFHHYSPTGFGFHQRPCEALLGQAPPLTATTHEWNMFDVAIDNSFSWPQITKGVETVTTTNIPTASDILLDHGSLALADSGSLRHSTPVTCPAGTNHLDRNPPNMRENDLAETSRRSCVPCVAALVPATEQANTAFSNISTVGDYQQRSAKQKPDSYLDSMYHSDYEKDTEPSQSSELVGSPCSRENDVPEPFKDSGTAENESAASGLSPPSTVRSTPDCSGAGMTPRSNSPVRYPSIAVVVPPLSRKQEAARKSTRAAAVLCNKRLRSGRYTGSRQSQDTSFPSTEQPGRKRRKHGPSSKTLDTSPSPSISASHHCTSAVQSVRGSALLTVDSHSGLKPAYYFTFVPDAYPMLPQYHTAEVPRKQDLYSSDENALLTEICHPFKSTIQLIYAARPPLGLEEGDSVNERCIGSTRMKSPAY